MDEPRMRGRPTKFTPETIEKILAGISEGLPYDTACALANCDYTTFRKWMQAAESENAGQALIDFFDNVKKAEAKAEEIHIQNIKKASDSGAWQAGAWILERRYPEKWGRVERLKQELTGKNGSDLVINLTSSSFKQKPESDDT